MQESVRDNPERRRYELDVEGGLALIDYRRDGGVVTMTHAEVPHALRGSGVGKELVRGALALVRQRGDKVVPLCPFVHYYSCTTTCGATPRSTICSRLDSRRITKTIRPCR